jgi:hypothetical protein
VKWDGCLPLLAAVSRLALPWVIPNRDMADMTAVIVIPILVALLRAHRGSLQLKAQFARPSLGRRTLFGGAIITLMLFDGLCGALLSDAHAPLEAWLAVAILYVIYLGMMTIALHPHESQRPES